MVGAARQSFRKEMLYQGQLVSRTPSGSPLVFPYAWEGVSRGLHALAMRPLTTHARLAGRSIVPVFFIGALSLWPLLGYQ